MSKKHESQKESGLIYVFVWLPKSPIQPRFFIVKSAVVAKYVKWEHAVYMKAMKAKGKAVKDTAMRKFRIPEGDPDGHQDNWKLLCRVP